MDQVALGIAIAVQPGEAQRQPVGDRPGDRAAHFLVVVGAIFAGELAAEGRRRAAAGLVEDAAGRRVAVQDRRRPLEDVDRFERIEIDPDREDRRRIGCGEPIDILLRREAAHRKEVVAQVRPVILAERAGAVAHRLLRIDEVEQVDLVAGDDRYRLRRLDQGGIGLGRRLAALRDIVGRGDDDRPIFALDGGETGFLRPLRRRGVRIAGCRGLLRLCAARENGERQPG